MSLALSLIPLALLAAPQESAPLKSVLAEMSRKADVYVVSVRSLEGTTVSRPPIDELTKENVEEKLLAMVKKLPIQGRLIRLNLPKSDRQWTAEEILTYARAEATLFKKPVGDIKSDSIEVLGHSVPTDKSKPVIETLNLRPVYVIALAQAQFGGTWESTYGTMKLEQKGSRVTGTYTTNQGTITGDIVGNQLRFIWFENGNGSGGRGTLTLSEDGMSFSGPWFTHENADSPAGVWTGKRVLSPG